MSFYKTVLDNYSKLFISKLKDIKVQPSSLLKCTFTCIALFTVISIGSQEEMGSRLTHDCGTDKLIEERLANDDDFRQQQEAFELAYRTSVKNQNQQSSKKNQQNIFTIPTVVHIIHRGMPLGSLNNPDDETIQTILLEASDRFRNQHTDAETYSNPFYGADTEIELCLADTDPSGNYTSGILRHFSEEQNIDPSFPYLQSLEYDTDLYMNIFIAESLDGPLGYYNGSSTVYYGVTFTPDRICHEVGHYLSLYHTFQNGCTNDDCLVNGDRICDTPPKVSLGHAGSYIGDCSSPGNECTTDEDDVSGNNPYRPIALGGMGDQNDMLFNYMESASSCRNSFTIGQKDRMHANINLNRTELINNAGAVCSNSNITQHDAGIIEAVIVQDDLCDHIITSNVIVKNYGSNPLTSVNIIALLENGSEFVHTWNGNILPDDIAVVSFDFPILNQEQLVKIFTNNPNNFGIDEFENNDTIFVPSVIYIGGSDCETVSACEPLNSTTLAPGIILVESGNPTTIELTGQFSEFIPVDQESIHICTSIRGSANEFGIVFDIYDESNVLRGQSNSPTEICTAVSTPFCFDVSIEDYNSWRTDGVISITLVVQGSRFVCDLHQACIDLYIPSGDSALFGCTDVNAHNYESQITYPDNSCETCFDGTLNGDETGVDCGGILCPRCIVTISPSCGADNGTASIVDPDNEITNIQWDAGANNQTTLTAFELAVGTYSVTVTELNGTTYTLQTTINAGITEEDQIDKMTAAEDISGINFGNSIDISGDWAVIGAERDFEQGAASGAAFVYRLENGRWTQFQKLKASDSEANTNFGFKVKIHKNVIFVNAFFYNRTNKIYVFRYNGAQWIEEQIIDLDDASLQISFDVQDDMLVIGSPTGNQSIGEALVYNYDGNSWQLTTTINPIDQENNRFGTSIAINEDKTIAIGATFDDESPWFNCGAVHIYQPNGSSWNHTQRILASDLSLFLKLGSHVELLGNRLVCSSLGDDTRGAVYVFEFDGTSFVEQQKLTASDGNSNDHFGFDLSISKHKILVGSNNLITREGRAYLFELSNNVWQEESIIIPDDIADEDRFGHAVELYDSDFALIGSPYDDESGNNGGSVYVYEFPNDSGDSDLDGVCDDVDNCLSIFNPEQNDSTDDGTGDACCVFSRNINTAFQSGEIKRLDALDNIHASNLIKGGAEITYDAASYTLLNNGFEVESSAIFKASIEGCDPNCQDHLDINIDTAHLPGPDNQQARFTIKADNTVSRWSTAIYHAGEEVLMTDGFVALGGSTFRAYIEGCSNTFQE